MKYIELKEKTKEELFDIADQLRYDILIKDKEIERLNNKLLRIKKLISRTPRQTPKEIAYIWLKSEIAEIIGVDKE